jgi:hypothetical protein
VHGNPIMSIVCMKILLCLSVGLILIYLVIWTGIFVFIILGVHLIAVLNTALFFGTNRI